MTGKKKPTCVPVWVYLLLVLVLAAGAFLRAQTTQQPEDEAAGVQNGQPLDGVLTVRFLNVGQGDSVLLACNGAAMLLDGGSVSEGQFLVSRLNRLGVQTLNYVVNTHPDEDHCGGLAGVLAKYPAEHVYASVTEHTTKAFSNVVKYAEQQDKQIEVPEAGDSWGLGDATVTVIGPVAQYDDTNNGSLVLRVDYGETSFLFTGDMEKQAEADLLASGANVRADVLKVGHHGSVTSTSDSFLAAVQPSIAVISAGEGNDYGHPHKETMQKLEAYPLTIYRTDTQGEIIVKSDAMTLTVTTDPTSREAADETAAYVGNINSQIVHSAACAKLPSEQNRMYFETLEEAEAAGFKPHTCIK